MAAFTFTQKVLQLAGLPQYEEVFKQNDIDDEVLRRLPSASVNSIEADLFNQVVSSVGHRLKILQIVRLTDTSSASMIVKENTPAFTASDSASGEVHIKRKNTASVSESSQVPDFPECEQSEDEMEEFVTPVTRQHDLGGMNFYACNQLGCAAQFELEEGSPRKAFLCPACQSVNCISCNAIHEGLECKQYLKILCDAIHAGLDVNGIEFRAMLEKEKLQGFDHLCDTVKNFASPSAAHEKRPRISYNETMKIMEQMHYIPTSKKFECCICANEEVKEGIVLQECLHTFCRECLVQVVRHSDDPEVKCPLDNCKAIISTREIQAVVPTDLFETFLNRSVNLAEKIIPDTFHCVTKDCTGWCITEETATKFWCPVCSKVNCLVCQCQHDDLTCEEYQQKLDDDIADDVNRRNQRDIERKGEEDIEKRVANRTYMRCPRCTMVCVKISGCAHVVCGSCKHHFNWRGKTNTDQPRGPRTVPPRRPNRGPQGRPNSSPSRRRGGRM